jgi:hypothetical protein
LHIAENQSAQQIYLKRAIKKWNPVRVVFSSLKGYHERDKQAISSGAISMVDTGIHLGIVMSAGVGFAGQFIFRSHSF